MTTPALPVPRTPMLRRAAAGLLTRPWLVTFALGVLVVLLARVGPDWPAQEFRASLARDSGLTAWNDQWYGGHALPGYSLLFPPVAAALGAALSGLLAASGCSFLVSRLVRPTDRGRRLLGLAFALTVLGNLFLGQVPFLLGLLFALAALRAVQIGLTHDEPRRRDALAVGVLAAVSSLCSPLAGAFLLIGAVAWALEIGWRRALPLGAAVAGSGVSLVTGGGGGTFPFPWTGLLGAGVFVASTLLLVPRRYRLLRRFVVVYGVVALAAYAVPNPVGGNMVRIGPLIAIPAAVWMLFRGRRRIAVVALALLPAIAWQAYPVTSAAARASGDPSVKPSYYTGLLSFLATQDPADGRLEIPFTREHWEVARIAPAFPIARGWERQTDLQYDAVLYEQLTAAGYRDWLTSAGVSLVALPDAPIDYGGKAEQTLLASPPAYLTRVWSDPHWTVWRVAGATPLVSGPATLTKLGTSSFDLDFAAAGEATVRLRQSSLWSVTAGQGCVLPNQTDGWVHVRATAPGEVVTRARVTLSSLLPSDSSTC